MAVRRTAAQVAMVLLLSAGTVLPVAAPAYAQDDQVRVQLGLPGRFTVGEKAAGVTVKVSKRSDGCVSLRTGLAIRLPGATVDQVAVQARIDDDWVPVPVADNGDGLLVTDRTAPENDELCKGKSRSVRYQVALRAGTPAGTVNVVAEAYTAGGDLLNRTAGSKKATGRLAGSYAPAPPSPTGEPTPEPTEVPAAVSPSPPPVAAPVDPDLVAAAGSGGDPGQGPGIGVGVLAVGLGMVAVGVALLVLLVRRGRGGRPATPGADGTDAAGSATMLLPRIQR
ncbi:hypothetical protein [Solwaraspora sp. WMMA2101]|uniref:hypothetical protein n=1 Tax=Solwaraspora sp. WMMA2101 TaxID=3404124 RepID=UPI003B946930